MYAVIIAGGVGKRFWPRSRRNRPKQFLNIISEQSMLEMTVNRLEQLPNHRETFIATGRSLLEGVRKYLPGFPEKNIILEPKGKNTAPCIALAAEYIHSLDPEAVMGVFPADHLILEQEKFARAVQLGEEIAREKNALVTFGITPKNPSTGYGYIQLNRNSRDDLPDDVFKVKTFAEKPNLETAIRFLESGDFLWNSGIFLWKASVILKAIQEFLPELYVAMERISQFFNDEDYETLLNREWATFRSISIDYGVMEKAKNTYVVRSDFYWSDIGSWDAVYDLLEKDKKGNVKIGDVIAMDSSRNYFYAGDRLIAAIGVEDLLVIDTEDALLLVKRNESQKVKDLVQYLEKKKKDKYL